MKHAIVICRSADGKLSREVPGGSCLPRAAAMRLFKGLREKGTEVFPGFPYLEIVPLGIGKRARLKPAPVTFQSSDAAGFAALFGLNPADFAARVPQGGNGFTVEDVSALVFGEGETGALTRSAFMQSGLEPDAIKERPITCEAIDAALAAANAEGGEGEESTGAPSPSSSGGNEDGGDASAPTTPAGPLGTAPGPAGETGPEGVPGESTPPAEDKPADPELSAESDADAPIFASEAARRKFEASGLAKGDLGPATGAHGHTVGDVEKAIAAREESA